ncbi:MAG: alkaline phosphatase family protein, partial [Deltaproteobacteria bacterium]|nr:alkaline phosphatase family protein [Deltaproteobacteria bacterium]
GKQKVIIIGVDGMDPSLSLRMMNAGLLPNLNKLRKQGGFSLLGTSNPPQSPVAWANFINGAGPGSHGIFDFIHRNFHDDQIHPYLGMSETVAGSGYLNYSDYRVGPLNPFNSGGTELKRHGTPFWDYLDKDKIPSTFYNLPSNYPASESNYGNHRCLSGMGTPDMLGGYGIYQHYSEDGPDEMVEAGGMSSKLVLKNEHASLKLLGPDSGMIRPDLCDNAKDSQECEDRRHELAECFIEFDVSRDLSAGAVAIEIQDQKAIVKKNQWSKWLKVDFEQAAPWFLPDPHIGGIVRFYVQDLNPLKIFVSPINADPSAPAIQLTEPSEFIEEMTDSLGLRYTTGFQEDYNALKDGVFSDDDFIKQADIVLEERLKLLDYALNDYDDGLLYFYFSSTDMQAHMLWWDSQEKHPTRSPEEASRCFGYIQRLYSKMDSVIGDILAKYDDKATIMVMSDHGFANFRRQFNLNTFLRDWGYVEPFDCTNVLSNADWSKTLAYGFGINGLYLNLKGREPNGSVEPSDADALKDELIRELEAFKDEDGRQVIKAARRTDKMYSSTNDEVKAITPDIIVGYARDFRASWDTCLGGVSSEIMSNNNEAWCGDHCCDSNEVPGVLFCNKPLGSNAPSLIDIAPTVLNMFGLPVASTMEGKNVLKG